MRLDCAAMRRQAFEPATFDKCAATARARYRGGVSSRGRTSRSSGLALAYLRTVELSAGVGSKASHTLSILANENEMSAARTLPVAPRPVAIIDFRRCSSAAFVALSAPARTCTRTRTQFVVGPMIATAPALALRLRARPRPGARPGCRQPARSPGASARIGRLRAGSRPCRAAASPAWHLRA